MTVHRQLANGQRSERLATALQAVPFAAAPGSGYVGAMGGGKQCCGIDEAGRGPLAGPVTAAAVVLPRRFPVACLNDSKQLTAGEREAAAAVIRTRAAAWAVGWCSAAEIDTLNIHRATLLAMWRALRLLPVEPDEVLIDGRFALPLAVPCRAIVKGDQRIPEIMAASIIAKTERDRFMRRYARVEPAWWFHEHKGYATPSHRFLLRLHGPSPIHRRSFGAGGAATGVSDG